MWIQFYNLRAHVSLVIAVDKFRMIRTVFTASNLKRFPTNVVGYDVTVLASQRKFGKLLFLHP